MAVSGRAGTVDQASNASDNASDIDPAELAHRITAEVVAAHEARRRASELAEQVAQRTARQPDSAPAAVEPPPVDPPEPAEPPEPQPAQPPQPEPIEPEPAEPQPPEPQPAQPPQPDPIEPDPVDPRPVNPQASQPASQSVLTGPAFAPPPYTAPLRREPRRLVLETVVGGTERPRPDRRWLVALRWLLVLLAGIVAVVVLLPLVVRSFDGIAVFGT